MAEQQVEGDKTIIMESDFNYQAPEQNDESADAAKNFNDVLAEIQSEFEDDEADQYLTDDDKAELGKPIEAKKDEPAEVEKEDSVDPKFTRHLERMSQRETAAKEAEASAAKRLVDLEAKLAEYKQYSGLKNTKELQEKGAYDAHGMLKDLGFDPNTFVRLALAQEVLSKDPPEDPAQLRTYNELKEFQRDAATKREISQLKSQIAEQQKAAQAQEYFNTVSSGAKEYVKSVGESTPTLAKLIKNDAQAGYEELMEIIVSDARNRASSDPDGQPMTYAEAAKKVEERLSRYAKLLSEPVPVTNSTNTNTTTAATQVKKPVPPQTKPANKPLAPWKQKQDDDIFEQGIQEALREYHLVNQREKLAGRR